MQWMVYQNCELSILIRAWLKEDMMIYGSDIRASILFNVMSIGVSIIKLLLEVAVL